jgi:hypothetical protein
VKDTEVVNQGQVTGIHGKGDAVLPTETLKGVVSIDLDFREGWQVRGTLEVIEAE